jgi:membrane protein implicated in regulation of membrane protease activity
MSELWEQVRSDRLLFGAAIAAAVDLWFTLALVDLRLLVVLPLLAVVVYAVRRVRGPQIASPEDVDDWY